MTKTFIITYYNGNKYLVVKKEATDAVMALQGIPASMDDIASVIEIQADNGSMTYLCDIDFVAWTNERHETL